MYCKNCGNLIDDNAVICPKCGVATSNNKAATQQGKTNTMAIVGLVMAFLFPLVGLICSIIGRKQCRETGENGMSLATAGMIISIVLLVLYVLSLIYIAVFAALLA